MNSVFLKQLAVYAKITSKDLGLVQAALDETEKKRQEIRSLCAANQLKILQAFQTNEIGDFHLHGSTGYGYGDVGRAKLEELWAAVFKGEKALVRSNIASGTHAIATVLFGILRHGDEMISISGKPYDTLQTIIGKKGDGAGTLKAHGIEHKIIELKNGDFDWPSIKETVGDQTKMVLIQRSRGYDWRASLTIDQIEKIAQKIKLNYPNVIIFVDNCYGEFVEEREPLEVGADIIAGSLIKNPGGGITPRGGYIVGRANLVVAAAERLMAPGIAFDVGSALDFNRPAFQGLFMSPLIVEQALCGAVFAASYLSKKGYIVSPKADEDRTDIIQAIRFDDGVRLLGFSEGIQKASALESYVRPVADALPGYEDKVVMAGGTFIQGSSIDLSVDGPMREPFIGYMQGGLSFAHVVTSVVVACKRMEEK